MNKGEATQMLLLTLDPGTTDSKICYRVSEGENLSSFKLLLMDSVTTTVSRESISAYEGDRITTPLPESEAWIKYDEDYYVTGFLAQRFGAVVDKKALKYEGAITKVLATVGVIATKEGLASNLDLALSIALPYSEWQDRNKIQQELETALSRFWFRGQEFSVNLEFFKCFPEGGGLMLTRGKKLGSSFNQSKIVSLMWGYRDLSVITSDRCVIDGQTAKLGFLEMLEQIQKLTSGLESKELLHAVHSAGAKITTKNIKHLAKSQNPKRKVEEVLDIVEVIKRVRGDYSRIVLKWLLMALPQDSHEIVIGGGTAYYFQRELKDFLGRNYHSTKVFWSADLEKDVQMVFNLDPQKDSICVRLADAYGLFRYMQQQVFPSRSPILTRKS
ncbi:MAG: ParM/StbA family protein [Xenococcaceae cyanobacterium MO_234.B1]|nr:ParM/StbA family protein [Xenococcaceae cyanobacterium MO_234.B1]